MSTEGMIVAELLMSSSFAGRGREGEERRGGSRARRLAVGRSKVVCLLCCLRFSIASVRKRRKEKAKKRKEEREGEKRKRRKRNEKNFQTWKFPGRKIKGNL
jgi:hypothetical protein